MKEKIKVGILIESTTIPAWQYHLLEQLLKSNCTSINLLILDSSCKSDNSAAQRESFLYEAFKRREENNQQSSRDACKDSFVE